VSHLSGNFMLFGEWSACV